MGWWDRLRGGGRGESRPAPLPLADVGRTFHEDGALKTASLTEDADIDGIPCAGGHPIELDVVKVGKKAERGRLLAATLSRDYAVGELVLPRGTRVHLYEEVTTVAVARLAGPLRVAGLTLPAGTELEVGEDEHLAFAVLGAPVEVDVAGPYRGRTLPVGTLVPFRERSWDLADVDIPEHAPDPGVSGYTTRTLQAPETLGGYPFPAGTRVTVREDEVAFAELPEPAELDGVPCDAGPVTFFLGKLHSARLAREIEREGLRCRAGAGIMLWTDGQLGEATLAGPGTVAGVALPAGARVCFFEELATPYVMVVPVPTTIRGSTVPAGGVVEFDHEGEVVRRGDIGEDRYRHDYSLVEKPDPHIDW